MPGRGSKAKCAAWKSSLLDLTENVIRLRRQLREIEIQAETQIEARVAQSPDGAAEFDPLELDRFTRFQELTRFMAESVNDVATVQQNLLKNLDDANAAILAQSRLNRGLQQELMCHPRLGAVDLGRADGAGSRWWGTAPSVVCAVGGAQFLMAASRPSPSGINTEVNISDSCHRGQRLADDDRFVGLVGRIGDQPLPQGVIDHGDAAGTQQPLRLCHVLDVFELVGVDQHQVVGGVPQVVQHVQRMPGDRRKRCVGIFRSRKACLASSCQSTSRSMLVSTPLGFMPEDES